MNSKNKKVLLLTDIEYGIEPIIQQVTNIQQENMLTIHSYDSVIVHPYGDIMRSIIIAIYQENVEEIIVVGIEDKETDVVNLQIQRDSIKNNRELDYLFENCMPEFSSGSLDEWLSGKENVSENIEKSIDMICHHPLVPSDVKVYGFKIDRTRGKETVVKIPTKKIVEKVN
ncbi:MULTISPECIES: carbonic anhydrase [Bacillus cereus group]|uniref:carbonic anhydrase n=1 Tax=Bacillus cereus group TaxID=86661 RepID=UPI000B452B70|nr:carbonic anhydrase [Bacillus thuringiensis]MDA2517818.1 carbonic anhydrase [Bacillus cereus]MED3181106.1 carbonic anhydrase [Bacillus thuringiensis]OTY19410.1 carbonic anhydrase [Bacillus thuringiensis serovar kim]OUB18982.1 carbonic anhydrase [Bacillus thuringiensis serovar xiaguangiensis]PGH94946.1 carbonic anhydrase [Bacillus thuringiensis]